ncbi:hypothetical protein IMCC26134_07365 [Verrucomicrobia bacterium IMCC26134]|jgi:dephospho-CoA kinase|nr:hypothetical protein IMCC26134_07365 [Verrucomicrobia bacterium IMCC26134]
MLIALTGGVGCGKSSSAALFGATGYRVRDADLIVREKVLTSPEVIAAVTDRWGKSLLADDGNLQRAKIAEIVFSDPTERRWLEQLVHPKVETHWRKDVAMAPECDWIVEIPLLFEARLEKGFDFVISVGASESVQIARLIARGMSEAQARQRIASQLPLAHKFKFSNAVIWNDGDIAFLKAQVLHLARTIALR